MLIPLVSVLVDDHADCRCSCYMLGPPDRPPARDPEADRLRRPGRGRLLAPLGRHRRRAGRCRSRSPGSRSSSLLLIPASKLNPADAEAKNLPGNGDAVRRARRAHRRRDHRRRAASRSSSSSSTARRRRRSRTLVVDGSSRRRGSPAPPRRRPGGRATRRSSRRSRRPTARREADPQDVISNLQHDVLPAARAAARRRHADDARRRRRRRSATSSTPSTATSRTSSASSILLTFVLLMRAFRSIVLPLKAVILNLISLALRVRRRRLHLPAGPRQRRDLGDPGDRRGDLVDPVDDLRVPVRALDGLRGLHRHAHPRGVRRDRATPTQAIALGLARTGQARDERGARARVRVLLALDRARARTSSSSGSASPPAC